ncbi:alpha/beta fold hydrolase [Tateyamaria omphalii]|uniref:Alpha/beta hydrolase n=1 Tax=Tateyamaria omphalii TaxID=299262 RepID=A0A1P8MX73_9RHOB|nr:alpha/beta hydrolase [Tateyamaria omphalii]APX12696.1 alpha/beta hydrolase [Tateyamaria omphalii]
MATPMMQVELAGHTLEYDWWGPPPGKAPTLVMLHEGLGSVGLWRDWPEALSKATGMGVLAYSRAGYGRSSSVPLPRPLDYMTREAVDVLGPLLDALSVQSAVLLGHSDGATIAAIYAGSVSDMRVRGLVLIAPHFFTEPEGLEAIRAAKTAYEDGDLKERLTRHHDHPDVAFYGWHDAWTDPGFADWNVGDAIDHWRIPALVVQGAEDAYGTLAQVREVEERAYSPVEALIVDGAGHAPQQDAPEVVTPAIAAFCGTLMALEDAPSEAQ